ncbi:hypothetical protein GPEL0_01r3736 [Geoanaerobacter pelophilus]|uniref:Uncharacterized protein n=1 Tax=Geoanaerobacter pelophilus TaxID=60036 RepID=A0ABQ0MKW6_9BACT|nr:hypothetical protein GPEL0_01r3736 [Geoanaerobacter pelophilus]
MDQRVLGVFFRRVCHRFNLRYFRYRRRRALSCHPAAGLGFRPAQSCQQFGRDAPGLRSSKSHVCGRH